MRRKPWTISAPYVDLVNMADPNSRFLVQVPPEDVMGPAMLALNDRQRIFVCALAVYPGNVSEAARIAGYGGESAHGVQVIAHRLAHDQKIIDAIKEETQRRLDSGALVAISTLVSLCSSADEKIALKASEAVADRTGFHAKSEHRVVVTDNRTVEELKNFIREKAKAHGLDGDALIAARLPAPVTDAEFTEVSGIEDLLA